MIAGSRPKACGPASPLSIPSRRSLTRSESFAIDRNGNAIDRDSLRENRADGRWGTDGSDTGSILGRRSGRVQTVTSNEQLNTAVEYASLLATRTGTRT